MMATMRAWVVDEPGPIDDHPLVAVDARFPNPARARSGSEC